jgi:hypothetical protein
MKQTFISPGNVGSVGDVLTQTMLKTSMPDLPPRNLLTAKEMERLGSIVQDGQSGYYKYSGCPRVVDREMVNLDRHTPYGWVHQDLRAPDKAYETAVSFSFSNFDNQRATIYNARRTGDYFLPLPGGYQLQPGQEPRGGLTPRITDLAAGDFTPGQGTIVTNRIINAPASGLFQNETSAAAIYTQQKRLR